MAGTQIEYDRPIKIADAVHWTGFFDSYADLRCNPYLIVDGDEAVVIDAGSRPDFPTVMMSILRTGISPSAIVALVFQHYDPDVCGGIPNFEDIIGRPDLKIISDRNSNRFIQHYHVKTALLSLEEVDFQFRFSSGRTLRFVETPYAHTPQGFVTMDEGSGVLFSSDLFGSSAHADGLFLELDGCCFACRMPLGACASGKQQCPLHGIVSFHRTVMPSGKALRYAMSKVMGLPFEKVAPQHGCVIERRADAEHVAHVLSSLDGVGIDGIEEAREIA